MAGFEYGEKLICLQDVIIGSEKYKAGKEFPYEDMEIDLDLVDQLLNQKKLIRASRMNERMLQEIVRDKSPKIIENYKGKRYVMSWPINEDIPEGAIDMRDEIKKAKKKQKEQEEETLIVTEGKEETDEEEKEDDESVIEVVPADKKGFFNVEVDGVIVNDEPLRKPAAEAMAEEQ